MVSRANCKPWSSTSRCKVLGKFFEHELGCFRQNLGGREETAQILDAADPNRHALLGAGKQAV